MIIVRRLFGFFGKPSLPRWRDWLRVAGFRSAQVSATASDGRHSLSKRRHPGVHCGQIPRG